MLFMRVIQDELNANRAKMDEMQDEHHRLLRQQEVLQAELQLALNNYQPKATIETGMIINFEFSFVSPSWNTNTSTHILVTGTPADKMLGMMSDLLDGTIPSIQDILFIQSAVLESLDIYKPMDVAKQLMQAGNLDVSS